MRDEGTARCEPTGYKVRRAIARRWQRPSPWNIEHKRIACRFPLTGSAPYKGGECVGPHGYDAGKKIKGKKRHVLVDTQGLLLHAIVHAADIQDRDGGVLLMASLFGLYPFLLKLYADGGYAGPQFQAGLRRALRRVEVEIVKRSDVARGFAVLPKRWIVIACTELPNRGSSGPRRSSEGGCARWALTTAVRG